MERARIEIKVNGDVVPNTLIFDKQSKIFFASDDYVESLVKQLLSEEVVAHQSVTWTVEDVAGETPISVPLGTEVVSTKGLTQAEKDQQILRLMNGGDVEAQG